MVQYHKFTKTKASGTGGHKRSASDKRKVHYGGFFARPRLSKTTETRKAFKTRGGKLKVAADTVLYANVSTTAGQVKKVKVSNVVDTPANRHYARENVVTQSAIIETELGRAKVTSRPGQDGVVNAVLIEKTEKAAAKATA